MTPFGPYAAFYDALYQGKDYEQECDFIEQAWERYSERPVRRVLDLGCGTGGHALPLGQRGYTVVGVDRSPAMLARARAKVTSEAVTFHEGDVRSVALGERFDAVLSLFAVLSYQCHNEELRAALHSAHQHLEPGGLFLFDLWFGPAVLRDPPADRYKIVEQGDERLIRFAHPEMDLLAQVVTVHYRLWRMAGDRLIEEVIEEHPMRFFFPQELRLALDGAGFDWLDWCPEGALGATPSLDSWTITVLARRR